MAHLRELGRGWDVYANENEDISVPLRIPAVGGSKNDPNYYSDIGDGKKYKPRWPGILASALGLKPFSKPDPLDDRQDFDLDGMFCPSVLTWTDERNYPYGYNYQFLGNARDKNGVFYHFPVKRQRIKAPSRTVMAADSMGTAAGFPLQDRGDYRNDSTEFNLYGNHGYTLDPPRLTTVGDRGDSGQGRSAVDPRHLNTANAVFIDGHGESLSDRVLGYRKRPSDRYVDLDPDDPNGDSFNPQTGSSLVPKGGNPGAWGNGYHQSPTGVADPASNHFFSGTGNDDDPPPIP